MIVWIYNKQRILCHWFDNNILAMATARFKNGVKINTAFSLWFSVRYERAKSYESSVYRCPYSNIRNLITRSHPSKEENHLKSLQKLLVRTAFSLISVSATTSNVYHTYFSHSVSIFHSYQSVAVSKWFSMRSIRSPWRTLQSSAAHQTVRLMDFLSNRISNIWIRIMKAICHASKMHDPHYGLLIFCKLFSNYFKAVLLGMRPGLLFTLQSNPLKSIQDAQIPFTLHSIHWPVSSVSRLTRQ